MKHGKKMMYGGKKKMMAGGKKAKPAMMKKGGKSKAGLKALAKSPKGREAVKKMGFDPAKLKKGGMMIQKAMGGLMKAIKEQDKAMKKMMGGYGRKK